MPKPTRDRHPLQDLCKMQLADPLGHLFERRRPRPMGGHHHLQRGLPHLLGDCAGHLACDRAPSAQAEARMRSGPGHRQCLRGLLGNKGGRMLRPCVGPPPPLIVPNVEGSGRHPALLCTLGEALPIRQIRYGVLQPSRLEPPVRPMAQRTPKVHSRIAVTAAVALVAVGRPRRQSGATRLGQRLLMQRLA